MPSRQCKIPTLVRVPSPQSPVPSHQSPVTNHQSPVTLFPMYAQGAVISGL
ncbi:hypothetical protein [Sphaerospermopsis sp. FACHB-1194]|uniref:hypothetical protein n=1 Tax=Sphaerospermopsis sp. FACHB-1194 TaxID=2692862 RepID=UPI00168189E3|nr:hypothetical protein [Sphaerospermopsis sp. FACHB-1194]MBD2145912.1 hypothetical protein [Sphaerospermopsis sp. FACHB-1194]